MAIRGFHNSQALYDSTDKEDSIKVNKDIIIKKMCICFKNCDYATMHELA
jgi:hypothetical protein